MVVIKEYTVVVLTGDKLGGVSSLYPKTEKMNFQIDLRGVDKHTLRVTRKSTQVVINSHLDVSGRIYCALSACVRTSCSRSTWTKFIESQLKGAQTFAAWPTKLQIRHKLKRSIKKERNASRQSWFEYYFIRALLNTEINYFMDLFSSEILAILLSTNSK